MNRRRLLLAVAVCGVAALGVYRYGRSLWVPIVHKLTGKRTVGEAVARFGDRADTSLRPLFEEAGLTYVPDRVAFLCFKEERRLELWGRDDGAWTFVTDFEIKGASGKPGPKLKEGDRQVPEGLYRVEGLNPNSVFHLSIKLNYPNEFDVERASADGRTGLGGDIFIHGNDVSVGCLAMGDDVAEQLFVLASRVGPENVLVVIAPHDFRRSSIPSPSATAPHWLPELYASIASELENFPVPGTRQADRE